VKTVLSFYGGVNEIGGNKILLEDRGIRIFLDFGQSFTAGEDYFVSWLGPRATNGLGDYFEFNLLPKIRGLYARQPLEPTDLPYTDPEIDAVFLSHAHLDHMAHVAFIDEKIPVYCGAGTKIFIEAMEKTSSFQQFGEHKFRTFRTGEKTKIGHLVVEPIHVDHSIPAAYGFIIQTSEGSIVYTGDLRSHGPRNEMTREFAEKARESEPIAMVSEGTRMVEKERRRNYSESQVEEKSNGLVSKTNKIVFVTHYGRDTDRFRTFYKIAKNNDRKIVISPKTAHLLTRLMEDKRLDLPDPMRDDNILVYFKRKKTGKFKEEDYYTWEREFMEKMVNFKYIREHQGDAVMDLDFYQFGELIDIKPEENSHFIHSMSEPYSEEDIEDTVMHNWLKHFNIKFHQLHASGHLNKDQLTDLIRYVNPKKLFPVHTEHSELFSKITKQLGNEIVLAEKGKEYKV